MRLQRLRNLFTITLLKINLRQQGEEYFRVENRHGKIFEIVSVRICRGKKINRKDRYGKQTGNLTY